MYEVIYKLNDTHVDELMGLYKQCWWASMREKSDVITMLSNSTVIGIIDNGKLIGFMRVLSDGVYKALIFDVIIDMAYRGKKLGQYLMDSMFAHPELSGVQHIELYCKTEMVPFYAQWGFSDNVSDLVFMRKVNG